jgi:hypothetical protein
MGFAWITWHDYTDEEYKAAFDAQSGEAHHDRVVARATAAMRLTALLAAVLAVDAGGAVPRVLAQSQ